MPEILTDTYLTIQSPSQGLFKEKGSKFLSFAYPVNSEKIIKEHLEAIKKEYFDARHHCYAYRLGVDMKNFRAFDDGEPSNSAGKPILGQIVASNLTDILIIVVRYFGGTLLGVGGLIQAYKAASANAIVNAEIVTKEVVDNLLLTFDYSFQNMVNRIIKDFKVQIIRSKFDSKCELWIQCKKSNTNHFSAKIQEMSFVNIRPNDKFDISN
jgi:uncharacterized YigZ family protein